MNSTPWDREMDQVDRDYANGLISQEERNKMIRDIERDYRESAQESARDAYERELDNW